jgi:hypothetical protein
LGNFGSLKETPYEQPNDRNGRWQGEDLNEHELAPLPEGGVTRAEPAPADEALGEAPALVALGDPDAGKSTLLKMLALAQQEEGPPPGRILDIQVPPGVGQVRSNQADGDDAGGQRQVGWIDPRLVQHLGRIEIGKGRNVLEEL